MRDTLRIQGFSRVAIAKDGKIIGDSGYVGPNRLVNAAYEYYLCKLLGSSAGSSQISYMAIGTGTIVATDATVLNGELSSATLGDKRKAVTLGFTQRGDSTSPATLQFTATFGSTDSVVTGSANISNIGLYYSNAAANTIFAGNTYNSSQLSSNQDVYCTYEVRFT